MSQRLDSKEIGKWRKRLQRFSSTDLGVAKFCTDEGVSVPSFYYWRRKLGQKASGQRSVARRGAFRPVAVIPMVHTVSIQLAGGTRLDVRAEHLDAVRTVVAELIRADRGQEASVASC